MYFPKFNWPRVVNPKLTFPLSPRARENRGARGALGGPDPAGPRRPQDDIAALIVEPIQGEGGDNHFRPSSSGAPDPLRRERHALPRRRGPDRDGDHRVDVGVRGAGRRPRHILLRKEDAGLRLRVERRILEEPENVFVVSSRINSTWGGNLVDMVRCRKFLEVMAEEHLVENARVVGEFLKAKLEELSREFPGKMTNIRAAASSSRSTCPTGRPAARCSRRGCRSTTSWRSPRASKQSGSGPPDADEGRGPARRPAARAALAEISAEGNQGTRRSGFPIPSTRSLA